MNPRPPAIVLGGDVTALSVARSLADAGVVVDVLDVPDSPARFSRSVKRFVEVGRAQPQRSMLDYLRQTRPAAVLLAGSDEGVELIARHRAELEGLGHRPVEGDDSAQLRMLDKAATYELARQHGIAAPRVFTLRNDDEVERAITQVDFPCVAKPVRSHLFARNTGSGSKVELIETPPELRERVSALRRKGIEMLVTEVIVGISDEFVSYYGYLDQDGRSLLSFTKRKIRQYPPGFGIGTYHETTADPEVAAAGLQFLRAAGVRGLGNVEFKRDSSGGELKLIECNVRFTMSNELIRAAGLDLALFCYCRAAGLRPPPIDTYTVGLTLWDPLKDARAFFSYRRLDELTTAGWLASVARRHTFPTFQPTDPLPAIARTGMMIRNAGRSRHAGQPMSTGGRPSDAGESLTLRDGMASRSIEWIAAHGRRGRVVAARADLVRATGLGAVWRRVRAEGQLATLGDSARDTVYGQIWTDAAAACAAGIDELAPGLFELSRDGCRTRVYHQMVEIDDPVTLHMALDKTLVHRLMTEEGIPSPERVEWTVDAPEPALAFLERVGGPCVVKPAAGTGGGHGVTPGIASARELLRARVHAGTGGERLLIERQADGDVYRLLFLDGELLDVIRSVPAAVVGDGRATLEELIARENRRRAAAEGAAGLSLLGMNLDTVLTLRRAGLSLSSVLPAGRRVRIRQATNNNAAEDNVTWRGDVAEELIGAARAASAAVGLRLAGIDIVAPTVAIPLERSRGVITEVNGTPGLHHHYLVAERHAATRVAIPILERLLSERVGGLVGPSVVSSARTRG